MRVPGGWYAAARPNGAYAVLVTDSHIETNTGRVPLPLTPQGRAQNLLWLDVWTDGRIAGIGHGDDLAWVWHPHVGWGSYGLAYGPLSVIFDRDGQIRVKHDPPPSGYRYVAEDGTLVTASETYVDSARRIYEYTTLGGITIGQGGEGPDGDDPLVALLPDGTARLLQRGRCRAIRFTREGDSLALGWSQEDATAAEVRWLTVAELTALPVYTRPPVRFPPPPPPPIVLPPIVVEPPPPVTPPSGDPMATIPALPGQLPISLPYSYDLFIQNNPAEVDKYAAAYLDAHGHAPGLKDAAQWFVRRLYEGYTPKAIIAGIYKGTGKVPPSVP